MDDSISRQAAINIVVFECGEWTGLAKEIMKQLRQLPPAQPEVRTQMSSADCISRHAAIDAVNAHYHDEYFNFYTVTEILKQLPPVQPDHSAEVSKMVNGDVVSRREAIDAVNSIDNLDAKARGGICFKLIGLPSAQLESIKCKDCGYAEERGCALFCGFWTRYTAHKGYCFKAERREENHG